MFNVTVGDRNYAIEFRHITKLGRRAQHYGIKSITTCVIVSDKFIALDHAICSENDNFSRAEGRDRAFHATVKNCGALKKVREEFVAAYEKATDPPDPIPAKPGISPEEVAAKISAGAEVRASRLKLREAKA